MKQYHIYFVIICILTISCKNNQKVETKGEINWSKMETTLYDPKEIIVPIEPLETETGFQLINDQYFFCTLSFYQDRTLYAYQLKNDTLHYIDKVTQKGNGPLEMPGDSYIHKLPNNSLLITSDGYNPKCFLLRDGDMSKITNLGLWEVINFPNKGNAIMANRTLPLNDYRIFMKTIGDIATPFAFYNANDSVVSYFPFPYPETDPKASNAQKSIMHVGQIRKHPSKDRILNTLQEGSYACIMDVEGKNIKVVKHIFNELPQFDPDQDGANIHPKDNKRGFAHIAVTEKYIYMKISDFRFSDRKKENINDGYPLWFDNKIYVFDWEGNPVRKYNLDKYVSSFVVDSNDKFIYAQTMDLADGTCTIIKYEL